MVWTQSSRCLLMSSSQKRRTVQPSSFSCLLTSWSRSMFLRILASQYSWLVATGFFVSKFLPCQKEESQKIAVLYFVRTISGFPGRSLKFFRYRIPSCHNAFRRRSSMDVSLDRMCCMFFRRCSGVISSMVHFLNIGQADLPVYREEFLYYLVRTSVLQRILGEIDQKIHRHG